MSMWSDVCDFQRKFELPQQELPSILPNELLEFRTKFLQEELNEFKEACEKNDVVLAMDALIDLVYVAFGTAHMMNVPFYEAWQHVHAANMRKVRAKKVEDSKRNSTFDVIKPEGWINPHEMLCVEVLVHKNQILLDNYTSAKDDNGNVDEEEAVATGCDCCQMSCRICYPEEEF